MRFGIMVDPEGDVSYGTIAKVARRAESLGFESFYLSDHYEAVFGWHGAGAPESWAILAALARETSRIAIGTMVSPVTLRRFSTLAKLVATVGLIAGDSYVIRSMAHDGSMSEQPRLHLGLGAGWLEQEHRRVGVPFPDARRRVDMLEEQLRALHAIWDSETDPVNVDGEHVSLTDFTFAPTPYPRPRIILGGKGKVRVPRLAAKYADELSVPYVTDDELQLLHNTVVQACHEVGRDPTTLTFSAKKGILVGADTGELHDRARRMQCLAGDGRSTEKYLDWLRRRWIVGLPDEVSATVSSLRTYGIQRIIFQHLLADDLSMLDLIAEEIVPSVTSNFT